MEFGLFTEFQSPAGMCEATAFDESMAQMRAAESWASTRYGWARSTSRRTGRCSRRPW